MTHSVQTNSFTETFAKAVIDLAGSVKIPTVDGKKTLLSIRDLKQYFPVKGNKNMFVKANDGITIDIHEGETLGLVGESGCGKSTLGRTLLQLYAQKEGRTFFYGQPLDRIAPRYLHNTIKKLPSEKKRLTELYTADRKAAEKAFLDIVQVFGGLLLSPDEDKIIAVYTEHYNAAVARNSILSGIAEAKLALASGKKAKTESPEKPPAEQQKTLFDAEEKLKQKAMAIETLRQSMRDTKGFEELERLREDGIDLARLSYNEMRHLRRDMQIIFQDPYSSLNPRMTVGQIIGEGPLAHGFFSGTGEALQDHVMRVMENCGLAPYMIHRYPHQFSGGQRQRIGIARSLAIRPKFVVCDEAVSALDVSIQSQILNLLSDLKEKEKLTYLFISHDLSVVKYISDRIGVMYLGNIVELAGSEEIFRRPLHPYTEALLSAIPTTNVDKPKNQIILEGDIPSPINPPKGCKFHTRCRYVTDVCKEITPTLIENGPGHFAACHHCLG
jgi:peptide/nickel transport system ATP-binding protein